MVDCRLISCNKIEMSILYEFWMEGKRKRRGGSEKNEGYL
jgi:hypothetical protein